MPRFAALAAAALAAVVVLPSVAAAQATVVRTADPAKRGLTTYAGWSCAAVLDEFERLRGESLDAWTALGITARDLPSQVLQCAEDARGTKCVG